MLKKKNVGFSMLLLLSILLASCEIPVLPIIFQASDDEKPVGFPATVAIDYYISNEAKQLYGDDKYIVFEWVDGVRFPTHETYPAEKTNEGYIIIGSKHKDFVLTDPQRLGYSKPFNLKTQNGQFEMTFAKKEEYINFFDDGVSGVYELCDYYKCSSTNEK